MFPAKTIQDDLQSWATSHQDSKTKWNKLKDAWSNYAKKRKLKNESNAIYEVVLQVNIFILIYFYFYLLCCNEFNCDDRMSVCHKFRRSFCISQLLGT